jgi:glycosyltransferase involved in cell wall biosynthesis
MQVGDTTKVEGSQLHHVSVVISTYAERRLPYVLDCIDSLRKQTTPSDEIILVVEPIENLLMFYKSHLPPEINVVLSESQGLSSARNTGVKASHGEIMAFIDDDAAADENWLSRLTEPYVDQNVIGTGGAIIPVWENDRPDWFPEELDWVVGCTFKGLPSVETTIRNPIGCNMSFRRSLFESAGYFKTTIGRFGSSAMAGEEAEFSVRATNKIPGSKITYVPAALVYHRVPKSRASIRYSMKRSFYEGYSKARIRNIIPKSVDTLTTEQFYLTYLLKRAIPSKLTRFYRVDKLSQSIVISIVVCNVLVGFVYGRIMGFLSTLQTASI